jgi:hypothetical protein
MNILLIQQKSGSSYELEPLSLSEFGFIGLLDFLDFRRILIPKSINLTNPNLEKELCETP